MQDAAFQWWSVSINGAHDEAEQMLMEAEKREMPALIDLGNSEIILGWHPITGKLIVTRKNEQAPAHLPNYLARLAEAAHVHAGGESVEAAVSELLTLFQRVAAKLDQPQTR